MAEIVIIGAGLTGLSAAYNLEANGYLDYEIFEQDSRPGGLLKTESVDGFNFDYTGHLLHISDPNFKFFLDTVLNMEQNVINSKRQSAIFHSNSFALYPFQMNLYGLPTDVIYDCINGFIKRKTSIKNPANFHQWVLKYFGLGLGKHFFFPYNSKLLSYDVKKILPSWTGRFVPQTNLKLILNGAIETPKDQNIGYNNSFYYPKTGGIEFLIKQVASKLNKKIKINHKAIFVDLKNKTVTFENGHVEKYNKLITTMPLKTLLENTSAFKHLSSKLLCSSVINFNLGFNSPDIGPWHWLYFPENRFPFYRLGFWNNISKSCVKPGHTGIYGETSCLQGTKTQKQIDKLSERSFNESLNFLGLTKNNVVVQKNLHMEYAYVIYDYWREKNLNKILDTLIQSSIYSVGRFGGWNYSSMQEAFLDGQNTAERILKEIQNPYYNSYLIKNRQNLSFETSNFKSKIL